MLKLSFEDCFSEKIGLCIKDLDKKVLFQNQTCKKLCGERVAFYCETLCMKSYTPNTKLPSSAEGMKWVRVEKKDQIYDAIIINDGNRILTLLYSLAEKIEREIEFLKSYQLSAREIEVMLQVLRGLTNIEISKILFISQNTLKTHLNNVYKKLPVAVVQEIKAREFTSIVRASKCSPEVSS